MAHRADFFEVERGGRRSRGRKPARSSAPFMSAEGPAGSGTIPASDMRKTRLDNGIVVLSERMPSVRSVATGVWVRQGGAHESESQAGASHLLEHMVFKGTRRRSAAEIALSIERLGGSLDAYTSREHTSYQARVLDEHLPEALDVLADLVLEPRLDPSDLDLEREVVLEEIAQVEDTPDDLVFELHSERFWGGHPYGRSILGTKDSVGGMPADVLQDLHATRYTGANLVVAAAGNVMHEEVVERVAGLFGGVAAGERAPSVPRPGAPRRGHDMVERSSAQTHIVFGTEIPGHAHPDRYTHLLLSAALGGGMSSRLFQEVRERLGLCYSVFSFQSFYRAAGVAGVYVGTRPGTAGTAVDAVRAELEHLATGGLTPEEFEDTKRQVKGQIMLSLESPGARMYRLASLELNEEPFVGLDAVLGRLEAVGFDDVRRVAGRHYGADAHYVLALGQGAGGDA